MDGLKRSFFISGHVLLVTLLLVYGASILIPLAVAILAWFLINAGAAGFQKIGVGEWRVPRPLALVLALVSIGICGFFVLELVISNLSALGSRTRGLEQSLDPLMNQLAAWTGMTNTDMLNKMTDVIGIEQLVTKIVSATANFSSQIGVVAIYVIFLLVEQQFFDVKLNAVIRDEERRAHVRLVLKTIAADVQSYIWIMTALSTLTAVLSFAAMKWVGLEHAAFWAFLIFVLNFIPTVGSILSTLLPTLFALVQFQGFSEPLALLAAIGVIQFLIGNFLQPRMAGKTLNMSQFGVVLSLFVWGAVWGIVGMFLAVPITAILMIILSNFETTRIVAILMSQDGQLKDFQHFDEHASG